ncbi:potassium transporter Trk [Microbacterium sp. ET2]|uniref:potassium transporter Trk n=1 Tax=Microbacterium albipurpureum TaxID=3050384 RepID=UPI00259C9BDB|nr:potassium transporter Trk [Microbacterium sp. ET2 (Ac-2212)]WJL97163.1 potassium transporter Trk [Microbacterium sp. ET2 (Ac-2212)]
MADQPHRPDLQPPARDEVETVSVRRSPKYSAFLLAGAALGILTALILTFGFDGSAQVSDNTGMEYSTGQVFGFLLLIFIPVGLAVMGAVALILDRTSGRRTRQVRVDHTLTRED